MELRKYSFQDQEIEWIVDSEGRPAVNARDIGIVLGFTPGYVPRVVQSIYQNFRFQSSEGNSGRPSWYLYEPGLYQMIFKSKVEIALKFQLWVFEDVLPSLRETGQYGVSTDQRDRTVEEMNRLRIYHELEQTADLLNRKIQESVNDPDVMYKHAVALDVVRKRIEGLLPEQKPKARIQLELPLAT